ncbi:PAS domain-containing protein [Sandaracinus amylolyticus]|uniref:PAS domain-containing protein n=1 Tax=Sandaracinus amylolyticus TaxID=927083 RepID=UPI001F1A6550|nr:PAS domain-containing protein [Sandaracinus amylolyticus]UJR86398.1 Hypothetical protein I5071_84930 [Sandaracinus amylolyticus]
MNGPGDPPSDLGAALAEILELVPTRIAYVDAHERFRFANRAYVAWHGRSADEVIGRSVREVLGERAYARLRDHIAAALAGETQRFDTEIAYAGKGPRWIEVGYEPRRGDDGRVLGFVVTVTDITDRKRAAEGVERARARIQHAFTQLPAFVSLALGPDHVLEALSPPALEALGARAVLGRPMRDLVAEAGMGAPVLALHDRVYREGEVVRTPATHYVLHGRERVFDSTYQPLRDEQGAIEGVIAFSLDVTERVLAARRRDLLASVGRALAEPLGPDATLACLVEAVVPAVADHAAVHRRDERPVAAEIARVIERGETICTSDVIVVPLALGGGAHGALELTRTPGSGRVHAPEDLRLAQEIARLAETALDRAHVQAALEEARANDAFMAEAAHILGASLDVDETLRRIARLAVPMLGDVCVLGVVERDGRHRQVAEAADDEAQEARLHALRDWSAYPLAPIARAIEHPGEVPPIIEIDDALLERIAHDADELAILRAIGARTSLAVPIAAHGRTLAVLHVGMARSGRRHGPRHRALAMRLAARAAISLENARLYTEARESAAERARDAQRLGALADISRVFAEVSLDPELAHAAIARIAAQKLGDLATINLLSPDGEWLETVALHHLDPARESLAQAVFAQQPTPVEGSLNGEAVRSGRSVRIRLDGGASQVLTDAGRRYVDAAHAHEVIAAPLEVRGRVLGTIAVTSEREGRWLDVALLEEIAHRAALLIENARLFRAAQDATRMRDELVATVSHELRTPLNAILGWAAIARVRTDDATLVTRALDTIDRNARAQAKLVDDLLDVARIVGGTLRLEREDVDPELVARAAIEALRPVADARQVRIELVADAPCPRVRADGSRLQQVVGNLVSNAVKFSRDEGYVRVVLRRHGDALELVVEDDGIGIEPTFLPHVFERFRQARPTPGRGKGGVGLGLAIVRHLVEAHGGSVSVASEGRDRGTRFVVRLPARPDVAESEHGVMPERIAPGVIRLDGVQVLLVEDDDDTREALRVALSAAGAEVVDARDGAEGLRALDRAVPDVIVSDVAMPVLDGYGFLRAVRARPTLGGGSVPAIAMTAFARPEDAWRAREAGFQTHLAKPTDPATVARVISEMAPRRTR